MFVLVSPVSCYKLHVVSSDHSVITSDVNPSYDFCFSDDLIIIDFIIEYIDVFVAHVQNSKLEMANNNNHEGEANQLRSCLALLAQKKIFFRKISDYVLLLQNKRFDQHGQKQNKSESSG